MHFERALRLELETQIGAWDPDPKGPCTYMVYTWALKLHRNPFKAPKYLLKRYMDPLGK